MEDTNEVVPAAETIAEVPTEVAQETPTPTEEVAPEIAVEEGAD